MRPTEIDQQQQEAIREAARFLACPDLKRAHIEVTEIVPLAPALEIKELDLKITRLWAISINKVSCIVGQGVRRGKTVYIAR
jgi:hypothetical protein